MYRHIGLSSPFQHLRPSSRTYIHTFTYDSRTLSVPIPYINCIGFLLYLQLRLAPKSHTFESSRARGSQSRSLGRPRTPSPVFSQRVSSLSPAATYLSLTFLSHLTSLTCRSWTICLSLRHLLLLPHFHCAPCRWTTAGMALRSITNTSTQTAMLGSW